jgi:hypothetical protein
MRRTLASSLFRVVFSFWFLVLVTEPVAAMHNCPLHDGAPAAAVVGHAAGHASPAQAQDTHQPHDSSKSHQCSCLGDCAASALTAALENTVRLPVPAAIAATRPAFPESGIIPVRIPHVLPFQNGPPLA